MTETDNDRLLRDFFTGHREDIADNGFSRRVIHHLPNRSNRLVCIWNTFVMAIAVILFVWLGGLEATWHTLREVFTSMIHHGAATLDPKAVIIAAVVLLFLGTQKISSLA